MKKNIFLFLMACSLAAHSQKTDLSIVNTVKPKLGQKMAFEAAYKLHTARFHKTDEKLSVYEIMTGTYAGYYHLVNGGRSYADFDKSRPDAAAHYTDLDKTFGPVLQETRNAVYRWMDSSSFHPNMDAEQFTVNVRHIKLDLQEDYRKESIRGAIILAKLKGKFWDHLSVNVFEEIWDGSDPVVVSIRNLKDGFKSLEANYYGPMNDGNPTYKDEYIKAYGTADWDKRTKLMDDAVVKNEQYIMRIRKDLGTQ
jgi:hypothetical protein